jgi:hypothetical protein
MKRQPQAMPQFARQLGYFTQNAVAAHLSFAPPQPGFAATGRVDNGLLDSAWATMIV